ncbi:MAG: hypothetical protein Q9182_001235 [Xanthomendoza sp. 2 TL-2023]
MLGYTDEENNICSWKKHWTKTICVKDKTEELASCQGSGSAILLLSCEKHAHAEFVALQLQDVEAALLIATVISLLAGVILSAPAADFIRPLEYARGSEETVATATLYFSRLVLGVQLVIAGVQLPGKYLKHEWKSLAWLLGPGMTAMWLSTALLVWGMVPNLSFVHALAVGACVTPTDPVLSNHIVKGKFADQNVPKDLQRIIVAESGANDGLGYPFLFIALYLIKYTASGGEGQPGGARLAMAYWFGETWFYIIVLSVIYGTVVGLLAAKLLHWAQDREFVDRESYQVYAIALAQTTDMLLNYAVFAWFGAVCPWPSFGHSHVIPVYRLIFLGILVLLFRRIPMIYAMSTRIRQIQGWQQILFTGFFGPIGVSAVFYLYVALDFLRHVTVDGVVREDAARLEEVIMVVVWFLVICSIVGHGLSLPLGKLGYKALRMISKPTKPGNDLEESISTAPSPAREQGELGSHVDGERKE